ncbi:MAG: bifunctional folylpolyglutamate synthase/dihydrofolate synthase [Deltaproteobacteria bacterium]
MSIPGLIVPGLERTRNLLELMGHPEEGLRYIHIAGTNGKGSTGLIIAGILQESGYKVGTYSSPHLHSYTERFRINGEAIPAEDLSERLGRMAGFIQEMKDRGMESPSEFEILTAVGFQYFHDQQPDFVVLEVGMGGIYDTTNVIDPLISVITGIDYDHTAYLGETLEEIAANKAGIIKPGRPVVTGPMDDAALGVIRSRASILGAPVYASDLVKIKSRPGQETRGQRIDINYDRDEMRDVLFSLSGFFQLSNLATALTTLLIMRSNLALPVTSPTSLPAYPQLDLSGIEGATRKALAGLRHPGRLEVLSERPLVIVDAAHNPQGTRALAESLKVMMPGKERVLVCGWLNDKDVMHSLLPLVESTRHCIVTRPEGARGTEWQRVATIWQEIHPHKSCLKEESIIRAVDLGLELLQEDEYLLITGSFYILDRARSHLLERIDKLSIC